MANVKTNTELKRVNINLPITLIDRVKEYADNLGINTTSAYVFLLNQALNQNQQIQYMPILTEMYKQVMSNPKLLETLSDKEQEN